MDHLGGAGDHAERDGRLAGQPGGDHHVLLASHGTNIGPVAGVPPRRDGRSGGLAEQERPAGCGPNGLPLLVSEVCGLDQDQVSGMGRSIQADGPTVLGDNFLLDEGVVDALLRLGVENLHEFRFLWASGQAIETWVAKI